jgi:HD-like signal output (HDOD) protein
MGCVPTLPALYDELMRELEAHTPSISAVSASISRDLGMTAKILQMANSATVERGDTVSTAEQAAHMLGLEAIHSMARTGNGCSLLSLAGSDCLNVERLWAESRQTSALAKVIAQVEQAPLETIDQAATAGLLHDIGALVFAEHASAQYAEALDRSSERRSPLCEAEQEIFDCTHAEVGAYLLGLWGIGESIVEAVAYHHAPMKNPAKRFSPLTAVHVADHLQAELAPTEGGGVPARLDSTYLERLGLTGRLPVWREAAAQWQKEQAHE